MKKKFSLKTDLSLKLTSPGSTPWDGNIVFFGTPDFAEATLRRLIQSKYKPVLVVARPDMPVGRRQVMTPPPVKVLAEENDIPVFQPEKLDSDFRFQVLSFKPELFIVVAYGKIIPRTILDIPKYGALNVHPSLLPRWRGPAPIQYAIMNGDKETGVTIMLIDEEVDHGNIVSSFKLQVSGTQTTEALSNRLADIGSKLLVETIPKWIAGKIKSKEQDHESAIYSKIITKEDGHIDWNKSASEIERKIRAFTPWPGSYTFWGDKKINIIKGSLATDSDTPFERKNLPGQVAAYTENKLAIMTGAGIFVVSEVQLAGKDRVSSKQFLNGYSDIIGSVLK